MIFVSAMRASLSNQSPDLTGQPCPKLHNIAVIIVLPRDGLLTERSGVPVSRDQNCICHIVTLKL
jgi:hypothetical protein